jgi:hypothetical protein
MERAFAASPLTNTIIRLTMAGSTMSVRKKLMDVLSFLLDRA